VTFLISHKGVLSIKRAVVDEKGVPAAPTTALAFDNGPLPFNHPLLCHPEAKPRDLQFLSLPQHCIGKTAKWFFS
jgi:hypothetical protein